MRLRIMNFKRKAPRLGWRGIFDALARENLLKLDRVLVSFCSRCFDACATVVFQHFKKFSASTRKNFVHQSFTLNENLRANFSSSATGKVVEKDKAVFLNQTLNDYVAPITNITTCFSLTPVCTCTKNRSHIPLKNTSTPKSFSEFSNAKTEAVCKRKISFCFYPWYEVLGFDLIENSRRKRKKNPVDDHERAKLKRVNHSPGSKKVSRLRSGVRNTSFKNSFDIQFFKKKKPSDSAKKKKIVNAKHNLAVTKLSNSSYCTKSIYFRSFKKHHSFIKPQKRLFPKNNRKLIKKPVDKPTSSDKECSSPSSSWLACTSAMSEMLSSLRSTVVQVLPEVVSTRLSAFYGETVRFFQVFARFVVTAHRIIIVTSIMIFIYHLGVYYVFR